MRKMGAEQIGQFSCVSWDVFTLFWDKKEEEKDLRGSASALGPKVLSWCTQS